MSSRAINSGATVETGMNELGNSLMCIRELLHREANM
jgi:hypothetical protein